MRAFSIFFALALIAMAAAKGGHVVDNNPGQANLNNPDPAFGKSTHEKPDRSAYGPTPNSNIILDNYYTRGGGY